MRVGVSGVSSTGKSTLTKAVADALKIPRVLDSEVHEVAWHMLATKALMPSTKYFPAMTRAEHINFERVVGEAWKTSLFVKQAQFNGLPHVISDESPLDFINYFYLVCSPHPELMPSDELQALIDGMWKDMETFDHIWYLPAGKIDIVDDQRRFTSAPQLKFWDYSLQGIIGEARLRGFEVREMTSVDLQERVRLVSEDFGQQ